MIDIDSGSSSNHDPGSGDDSENLTEYEYEEGRKERDEEFKEFVSKPISQAIEYSIIRGSSFDRDYKRKLLNNLTIDRIN